MIRKVLLRLDHLISSLSPQEKASLVRTINSSRHPGSKRSKLLDLLNEIDNDIKDGKLMSGKRKLMELLENRILDCLIMDVNLLRDRKYQQSALVLQKEGIKSRILHFKGVVKRAYVIAENNIRKAKEMENIEIVLNMLHHQISMISMHQDEGAYLAKVAEIDYYERSRSLTHKAYRLFTELRVKKHLEITENLDMFVELGLKQLRQFISEIPLTMLEFIILYFEREEQALEGNFSKALKLTSELRGKYNRIQGSSIVFNVHELEYDEARLMLKLHRAEEATFLLQKCISNLPTENVACQQAYKLLFLNKYRLAKYEEAQHLLNELKLSEYYENLMPAKEKAHWMWWEASVYFAIYKFNKCIRILSMGNFKPLEGIERVRIRLLKIMALVETEHLDMADRQMEATRKFIQRNDLSRAMRREALFRFFELLTALKYCGYNFRSFAGRHSDRLESNHRPIRPGAAEDWSCHLIDHYEWLRTKIDQKPPYHVPPKNQSLREAPVWYRKRNAVYTTH